MATRFLTILIAFTVILPNVVVNAASAEWPHFIVANENTTYQGTEFSIWKFNPRTWLSQLINSGETPSVNNGVTANDHSNKVCRFHAETYGIICHQNKTDLELDIPRRNYQKGEPMGKNVMSLSPFGDQLIFDEKHGGGVWIFSLESQKARLLIADQELLRLLQVDWNNGYLLALPLEERSEIQVWALEGHSGGTFISSFGFFNNETAEIISLTIDTATMTAYWITKTFLAKKSYLNKGDEPTVILEDDFALVLPTSFCFYNGGVFWQKEATDPEMTSLVISRFDIKSRRVSTKRINLSKARLSWKATVVGVFEDTVESKSQFNPCSKCSHICVPRRGYGYECTCPLDQPLLDTTAEGVKTTCKKPLTLWVVAQQNPTNTSVEAPPKSYLQTYDAMAKRKESLMSTMFLSTSSTAPAPYPCNSTDPKSDCFTVIGGPVEVTSWFNGTCALYLSNDTSWQLDCNSDIDPDQVVLDRTNWNLFYRNRTTEDLLLHDLNAQKSTEVISTSKKFTTKYQTNPMRVAVDEANQVVYWLTASKLYQMYYDPEHEIREPEVIFDLDDRGFKDQQLRFIEGLLYWVQIRSNSDSKEHVVVRFNVTSQTQETFVKVPRGFSITSFGVATPSTNSTKAVDVSQFCSSFCRKRTNSIECLDRTKLPLPLRGDCPVASALEDHVEHDTSSWVIFAILTTLLVMGILSCIGFGLYYKYNREVENDIAWNRFVYEHNQRADALRAQEGHVEFDQIVGPQQSTSL